MQLTRCSRLEGRVSQEVWDRALALRRCEVMADVQLAQKYANIQRILSRKSPFADADAFDPGAETISYLHDTAKAGRSRGGWSVMCARACAS